MLSVKEHTTLCVLVVLIMHNNHVSSKLARCIVVERRCCQGGVCFYNAPPYQLLPLPQCVEDIQPLTMTLYTRSNLLNGQLVNRNDKPSQYFDGSKLTYFVVHGFTSNGQVPWLQKIKKDTLTEGDYNVIVVDWAVGANDSYVQSASNTLSVGKEIGLVVDNLIAQGGSHQSRITCVGHSLGAHVCGFAGKHIKLGRITGMDPARPQFEGVLTSLGLDKDGADYVDVMHTSNNAVLPDLALGIGQAIGHVDFYLNNGGTQPQCQPTSMDLDPACSHTSAAIYYGESILNKCFKARKWCQPNYIPFLPDTCTLSSEPVQIMGFDSIKYKQNTGKFYLNTTVEPPYCLD